MVNFRIIAVLLAVALVCQPALMYRSLRRLGGANLRQSFWLAAGYYAFVGGFVALVFAKDSRLVDALPEVVVGLVGWAGVVLVPLSPIVTVVQRRLCVPQTGHCSCGYDLRGNASGVCPECGRAASSDQAAPVAGGLLLRPRVGAAISIGLLLLTCYVQELSISYCNKCARKGAGVRHGVCVPLTDLSWQLAGGAIVAKPSTPPDDALTKWLDPSGTCSHTWQFYGSTFYHIGGPGRFACGRDATESIQAAEADFDDFMADHPEVIPRIRESLRRREAIRSWLDPMVVEWRGAPYGPDDDSPQRTR